MELMKGAHSRHVTRNQSGGGELRKFGDRELFWMISDGRTGVEYSGALLFRILEQVCGVHVLHVEWRILAHHDSIKIGQRRVSAICDFRPPGRTVQVSARHQLNSLSDRFHLA